MHSIHACIYANRSKSTKQTVNWDCLGCERIFHSQRQILWIRMRKMLFLLATLCSELSCILNNVTEVYTQRAKESTRDMKTKPSEPWNRCAKIFRLSSNHKQPTPDSVLIHFPFPIAKIERIWMRFIITSLFCNTDSKKNLFWIEQHWCFEARKMSEWK